MSASWVFTYFNTPKSRQPVALLHKPVLCKVQPRYIPLNKTPNQYGVCRRQVRSKVSVNPPLCSLRFNKMPSLSLCLTIHVRCALKLDLLGFTRKLQTSTLPGLWEAAPQILGPYVSRRRPGVNSNYFFLSPFGWICGVWSLAELKCWF